MMNELFNQIYAASGFELFSLISLAHMLFRAFCIYFFSLLLVRSNKKFLGIRTPFNFILFVIIGTIAKSAVLRAKFFIPILCILTFLALLNGLITILSFYFKPLENLIKGDYAVLVKNGAIQWKTMAKHFVTEKELINALHTQLHTDDLKQVKSAFLASDGTINFVTK